MSITSMFRSARGQGRLVGGSELTKLNDRQLADVGVSRRQIVMDVQGEIAHLQSTLGYPYGR